MSTTAGSMSYRSCVVCGCALHAEVTPGTAPFYKANYRWYCPLCQPARVSEQGSSAGARPNEGATDG